MQLRNRMAKAAAAVVLAAAGGAAAAATGNGAPGAVFVLTNQAPENSVMSFARGGDGTLLYAGTFPTGGAGAGTGGDPLGSQGALAATPDFLFAVNAGSNEISAFHIAGDRLELRDRVASGGTKPVSVAVRGRLLYVLNAGAVPNITAFVIEGDTGHLAPLPNSQRPLAGGAAAAPAEVHFGTDGESLVVTEKGTQQIDTFRLDADGYAAGPHATPAGAAVPFGFDVTRRGVVVVSEAGAGAVSAFDLQEDGQLAAIGGPLALGQAAPCWVVTSLDGRYAYTANAGSGSISSLRIDGDGALSLVEPAAATLAAPIDMALSRDGHFLYVREATGTVSGFRLHADGGLELVTVASGIPVGAQGITAH